VVYGQDQADFRGAVMIDNKPDIKDVLQGEGVEVRRGWGLCPLGVGL